LLVFKIKSISSVFKYTCQAFATHYLLLQ